MGASGWPRAGTSQPSLMPFLWELPDMEVATARVAIRVVYLLLPGPQGACATAGASPDHPLGVLEKVPSAGELVSWWHFLRNHGLAETAENTELD